MSLRGLDLFLVFGLVTIQGNGYSVFKKKTKSPRNLA